MKEENTVAARTSTYLQQLLADVFREFEDGNAYALQHFENDGEQIHPYRLFDTMRYKTRLGLETRGYTCADLSMYGLEIEHKGYVIKILKQSPKGGAPIPGTPRRLRFYNHNYGQRRLGLDDVQSVMDELGLENRRELVILYKIGSDGRFQGIELVCIDEAPSLFAQPRLAWRSSIPHPALTATTISNQEKADDLDNIQLVSEEGEDQDMSKDGTNDQ